MDAIPSRLTTRMALHQWLAPMTAWLGVWIATPIAIWLASDDLFPLLASLGVLTQTAAVIFVLRLEWPLARVLRVMAVVGLLTWLVEFVGVRTGFPFGPYHYTAALLPQVGGVPLLIPLAWFMMLPPAWGVVTLLLSGWRDRLGGWYWPVFALLTGLAFTAWDLFLDPQMTARGLWTWENPGGYFGIPWVNFGGWCLSSALITLLVRPAALPVGPLLLVYSLTWAFQAVGLGLFWGQPGPAAVGFAGMGVFMLLAWRSLARRGMPQ